MSGTTIINGKKPIKKAETGVVIDKPKHLVNSLNGASLERKIDSGEVTIFPKISSDDKQLIINTRVNKKINDKSMNQQELANLSNQRGGKSITTKDITEIESGRFILNHENKLKLTAVKRTLGIK